MHNFIPEIQYVFGLFLFLGIATVWKYKIRHNAVGFARCAHDGHGVLMSLVSCPLALPWNIMESIAGGIDSCEILHRARAQWREVARVSKVGRMWQRCNGVESQLWWFPEIVVPPNHPWNHAILNYKSTNLDNPVYGNPPIQVEWFLLLTCADFCIPVWSMCE